MLLGLMRFIARFQSTKMCHATFRGSFHTFSIFLRPSHIRTNPDASCRDPGIGIEIGQAATIAHATAPA